MKIFVTGFQRSGTTLLKDLIQKHPDVKVMFHETGLLKYKRERLYKAKKLPNRTTKSERKLNKKLKRKIRVNINFDMSVDSWGEKIPYMDYMISKGGYRTSIYHYCTKWNKYFQPDARILHIIRHPMDMGISTKNIGYTRTIRKPIRDLKRTFPRVMRQFKGLKNIKHIKYEDLLFEPEKVLKEIFDFCDLDSSPETIDVVLKSDIHSFGFINKERAFNYKNEDYKMKDYSLRKVITLMNTIKGVKYEWKDEEDDQSS